MSAQKVGKYTLIEKIGQGGMGQIWLGRDDFGHEVAIKFLGGIHDPEKGLRRFLREAATLSTLQHRNICRIYGIERGTGGSPAIVMEYEKGVNLGQLLTFLSDETPRGPSTSSAKEAQTDITILVAHIEKEKHLTSQESGTQQHGTTHFRVQTRMLPIQQSLALAAKICDAVQYAHERGVLHRDIKPSNIMIRHDAEPVLLDFGVAKFKKGSEAGGLTGTRDLFGTIDYMAPEQIASSKDVDERADVFSVGVILYELLTGHKYFSPSGNVVADVKRREHFDPIRPRICNRVLDKEIEAVLLKAVAVEPRLRYRCASHMAADIERYRNGLAVSATPPMPLYRTVKWARRHVVLVSLVTTVLLLVVALGLTYSVHQYRQWGKWVKIYSADFCRDNAKKADFVLQRHEYAAGGELICDSEGLQLIKSGWLWLSNGDVRENVRVDMRVRFEGIPNAVEIIINGANDERRVLWHMPRGYSCQVGGFSGTLDFVSINKQVGPPSLSNAAVSRISADKEHRIMFQREGSTVRLYVDGKLQMQVRDPFPFVGGGFGRIGVSTYSSQVRLLSLDVYHQALAEQSSPLVVPESFMAEQLHDIACDKFLGLAADYRAKELGEKALVGAFFAASELRRHSGIDRRDSILSLMQRLYPQSRLWEDVGEGQMIDDWIDGNYDKVLVRLPDFLRACPGSDIVLRLADLARGGTAPGTVMQALISFISRQGARGFLDISRCGLQDLTGVGSRELIGLDISQNNIRSLEPLAGSRLVFLRANRNRFSDLAPLRNQPLRFLDIGATLVSDLDPIKDLPLVSLSLLGCPVSHLPVFSSNTLKELVLPAQKNISDLSPLAGLALKHLTAVSNVITTIEPLRGMPLTALNVGDNLITDFSVLQSMPLRSVYISDNPAAFDPGVLNGKEVVSLYCARVGLTSLDALANLPLATLDIAGNGLVDITRLSSLKLSRLSIDNNPIESIEVLKDMSLEFLDMVNCPVRSLEPLRGKSLRTLDISGSAVRSLDPLLATPPEILILHKAALPRDSLLKALRYWRSNPSTARLVAALTTIDQISQKQYGKARDNGFRIGKREYLAIASKMNYADAAQVAAHMGARLFSPQTREEHKQVLAHDLNPLDWVWTQKGTFDSDSALFERVFSDYSYRSLARTGDRNVAVNVQFDLPDFVRTGGLSRCFVLLQWEL